MEGRKNSYTLREYEMQRKYVHLYNTMRRPSFSLVYSSVGVERSGWSSLQRDEREWKKRERNRRENKTSRTQERHEVEVIKRHGNKWHERPVQSVSHVAMSQRNAIWSNAAEFRCYFFSLLLSPLMSIRQECATVRMEKNNNNGEITRI